MKIYRPEGRCNISGERVREARERADLSQERLAYKIQIAGAKLKTLLKVCVALECRLEDIVTDDETLALIAAYNRR